MPARLVMDVSTLAERAGERPTGIDRILLETSLALLEQDEVGVAFCRYDAGHRRYRDVTADEVRAWAERMTMAASVPAVPPAPRPAAAPGAGTARPGRISKEVRAHRAAAGSAAKRAAGELRATARGLAHDLAPGTARARRAPCASASWGPETVYCSLGMDFAFNDLGYLRQVKEAQGFATAFLVYDLIPVLAPQFATRDRTAYYEDLLALADVALTMSDAVAGDILAFSDERGTTPPHMVKVPVGSGLHLLTPVVPVLPAGIDLDGPAGFVLMVGTITPRKNHALLLDVWARLLRDRPAAEVPALVLAGSRGAMSEEVAARIDRDPELLGHVHNLQGLSDPEIAWLYRRAAFTVFPTLFEGWGLPVSESHDLGTACIASDRSSVPEAAAGLAVLLPPDDCAAWQDAVTTLTFDHARRGELERRIADEHRPTDASDTAKALVAVVRERAEVSP